MSPIVHIYTFLGGLSSVPLAKSWLCAKHWPRLLIFQSTISVPQKVFLSKISDDVIASSLPPQFKILATPMAQHARIVEKGSNFLAPPKRNFAP